MGIGQAVACELLDSVHSLVRQSESSLRRFDAGHSWLSHVAAFFGLSGRHARDSLASAKHGSESEALRCLASDPGLTNPSPDSQPQLLIPSPQNSSGGTAGGRPSGLQRTSTSASGGVVLSSASDTREKVGAADFVVAIATHRARHSILRATTAARKVGSPVIKALP
jgi:hypothetical protein